MILERLTRSGGATAPTGNGTAASTGSVTPPPLPVPQNNIDALKERLERINDEAQWQQTHAALLWQHNVKSVGFWLLVTASGCFAILNGYHGYTTSGGALALAAVIIGVLYAIIECTVPISAHLMSWGAKGQARFMIRGMGFVAYCLGVSFSLLILQGKFSSGADSASAQAEAKATIYDTDRGQMARAKATVEALSAKVGTRSADSVSAEMKVILSQPTSKKTTLEETTDGCTGTRRTTQEKKLCGDYDTLRKLLEDAKSLDKANAEIARLSANLTDVSRTSTKSADASDKALAKIINVDLSNLQMFKASAIAMVAALLTHMLWAAHGMTVNGAIARKRAELMERNTLQRAVERESTREERERIAAEVEKRRIAEETSAAYLAAKGTNKMTVMASVSGPLIEQPAVVQLQRYFTERSMLGNDFSMQISQFHDDYSMWCRHQKLTAVSIERFVQLVKDIGMGISADGRVLGAAIK
jgi:heme exporter protein D